MLQILATGSRLPPGVAMCHSSLESHPMHRNPVIAVPPAVFVVRRGFIGKRELEALVRASGLDWRTSYGGVRCRINPYPVCKMAEGWTEFRVAVGSQDDPEAIATQIAAICS